ncbi:MAG: hypothetical protein ACI9MR_003506 [Myxococcota bacterium]|jgi:hypothetical protein
MNALVLTLFVSLGLVVLGLIFFLSSYLRGDNEHADRLALLPLADDDPPLAYSQQPPSQKLGRDTTPSDASVVKEPTP